VAEQDDQSPHLKSQSTGGFAQIKSEHTNGDSHFFSAEQESPKAAFAAAFAAAAAFSAANTAAAASSSPVPKRSARFQYATPPNMLEQSSITITRIMIDIYNTKNFFLKKKK
jgi:Tfp pilus assembly protein PilW